MRKKMFAYKREGMQAFGVYGKGAITTLALKSSVNLEDELGEINLQKSFDSFVADEFILKKVLQLGQDSIQFSGCATKAKEAALNGDGCLSLFLNAPRMDDLIKIVNSGESVPLKTAAVCWGPVDGLVFYSMMK